MEKDPLREAFADLIGLVEFILFVVFIVALFHYFG